MFCHICGKGGFDAGDTNKMKVRDHCHLTGKFRGAAHSKCNYLGYQIPMFIPVVFHNLSGYDSHFLIKKLRPPRPIAKTEEDYISFSKRHVVDKEERISIEIRFIDSFRFMSTSLDALTKNLDPQQRKNLKKYLYPHHDLFKRKGVYLFDYVDSVDKLAETALPPKKRFIRG